MIVSRDVDHKPHRQTRATSMTISQRTAKLLRPGQRGRNISYITEVILAVWEEDWELILRSINFYDTQSTSTKYKGLSPVHTERVSARRRVKWN